MDMRNEVSSNNNLMDARGSSHLSVPESFGSTRSGLDTSSLLQTFGAIKTHDPYANRNTEKVARMECGMAELLDIQSPDELRALCGALGMKVDVENTHIESKEKLLQFLRDHGKGLVMDYIRSRGDYKERAFAEVLGLVWEGVCFEYLRSKGLPIRQSADPRKAIVKLWLEGLKEPKTFTPMYIQRKTRLRDCLDLTQDLRDVIQPIEHNELLIKKVENRMRIEKDHRNVMLYLNAVTSLRTMERHARDHMKNEIFILRARHEHDVEIATLLQQQVEELEERYREVQKSARSYVCAEEEVGRTFMNLWSNQVSDDHYLRGLVLAMLHETLPKVAKVSGEVAVPEDNLASLQDAESQPADVLMEFCRERYLKHMNRLSSANKKVKQALIDSQAEVENLKKALQIEKKRADDAEAETRLWQEKYEALSDSYADTYAKVKTEADMYMSLASDHMLTAFVHEKRMEAVKPPLLKLLRQTEKPELVSLSAHLLETLGLASRQSILEICEQVHMAEEEAKQRHYDVMQMIQKAIISEGEKAKKGKAGAKGSSSKTGTNKAKRK